MVINSNLRIGGLSTGIDTDSVIKDLMKIARMPLDKKIREKQLWTWKREDYRSINLSLLSLKNKAFDMKLESPYLVKKVISENEDIVSAVAIPTAANGTYSLKVASLATTATNASTGTISADPGNKIDPNASLLSQAGKFSNAAAFFDGKTQEDTFTVAVNGEVFTFSYGDSLNAILSDINENKKAGVSLFYDHVTDKLAVNSTVTGADAKLELTGDFFSQVLQIDNSQKVAGTDASLELNGLKTTRSGNTFTINGITFNLKGITPGGFDGAATIISIKTDTDAVYNAIVDFVNKYNEVYESINKKLQEEKYNDYYPLTDEEKAALSDDEVKKWEERARSGILKNDYLLQGLLSSIRGAMSRIVQGVDGPRSLAAIGINTGNYWDGQQGKLKINESQLRAAIEEDPEGVARLFNNKSGAASEQGIATALYDTLNAAIGRITSQAGSAATLYDRSYISRTIRDIDERIKSMEDRLAMVEERYWRQFTAMEKAISSLNQQSSWLSSQLMGMMGR